MQSNKPFRRYRVHLHTHIHTHAYRYTYAYIYHRKNSINSGDLRIYKYVKISKSIFLMITILSFHSVSLASNNREIKFSACNLVLFNQTNLQLDFYYRVPFIFYTFIKKINGLWLHLTLFLGTGVITSIK